MSLTKRTIDALKYNVKPRTGEGSKGKKYSPDKIVWDDSVPGFGVRVFPPDDNGRIADPEALPAGALARAGASGAPPSARLGANGRWYRFVRFLATSWKREA